MASLKSLINSTLPSVPFLKGDYAFSQLIFKLPIAGAIDDFGNPTGSESFIISAHLYLVNSLEVFANPAQGEQNKVYRGHCVNPKILPLNIGPGASGVCQLGDRAYDFMLLSIDRTAMPAYADKLGERLEISLYSNTKSV